MSFLRWFRRRQRALGRLACTVAKAAAAAATWTHRNAEDVALVGGYAAIAAGCFWIFGPAGLIVGGLLAAGTALRSARSAELDVELDQLERHELSERRERRLADQLIDED